VTCQTNPGDRNDMRRRTPMIDRSPFPERRGPPRPIQQAVVYGTTPPGEKALSLPLSSAM
jgi:hypothetical protein